MTAPTRTAVTGMYAGPVSRLAAFALDLLIVTTAFTIGAGAVSYLVELLTPWSIGNEDDGSIWWLLAFGTFMFLYWFVSLATVGRTAGKAVVGLRVVQRSGAPLHVPAAFVRTVTEPLSFLFFGLGLVGIVVGKEHRALHDVLAGTAVAYDWGDRPAEMPGPLSRFVQKRATGGFDGTAGDAAPLP